ncbi:MAG: glycosyltransferase family 9 protein, partial [Gemmatimonadota bacterium]
MSSTRVGVSALPARGYDRARETPPTFRRVLVVRFGRIGDLLMLTPALRALGVAAPEAAIDLLTTPIGAATLATSPRLRARHVLRWRRIPHRVNPEKIRLVRRLRSLALDAVFLFERAPRFHALVDALGV